MAEVDNHEQVEEPKVAAEPTETKEEEVVVNEEKEEGVDDKNEDGAPSEKAKKKKKRSKKKAVVGKDYFRKLTVQALYAPRLVILMDLLTGT